MANEDRHLDAKALGSSPHLPIGEVAHMPAASAGAVDHTAVLQSGLGGSGAESPFSGRRAANVAEADKKHSLFSHGDLQSDQCDAEPRLNAFEPRQA